MKCRISVKKNSCTYNKYSTSRCYEIHI